MRRRIEMSSGPALGGKERSRMLMLTTMLMLVGALMYRARDPQMWRMFGGDDRGARLVETADDPAETQPQSPAQRHAASDHTPAQEASPDETTAHTAPPVDPPENTEPAPAVPPADTKAEGEPRTEPPADNGDQASSTSPEASESPLAELPPPDEDEEEQSALAEELTAVSDKTFNQPEEMFAYYRLLRWAMSQSVEQLHKKAIQNPRYGDIFERPQFYRGKLVEFQLRVRRVLQHKDLEKDNLAGVKQVWELVGFNDTSGQNFYMCVTDDLPDKMSYGDSVVEDGRFVGYFFKLMRYEDREGKNRAIPLFIGKFIWDPPIPQIADPASQLREVYWVLAAAGIIAIVLLGRWVLRTRNPGSRRARLGDDPALKLLRRRRELETGSEEEPVDIESWLQESENASNESAINPAVSDDFEKDGDG